MDTKKHSLLQKLSLIAIFMGLWCSSDVLSAEQQDAGKDKDLLSMSIEQLMEVPVTTSGSLTNTSQRKVPAATTTITKDDIQHSGARNLDELLDIYVPNYEYVGHPVGEPARRSSGHGRRPRPQIPAFSQRTDDEDGLRISSLSERDLPMLTDINHIEVIRGPGSAMYGPGAISMVINIVTENANTFQGTEVTGRLGGIEEYYSGEFKYGKKFKDDSGIFLYGGTTDYLGADAEDAPYVSGREDIHHPSIPGPPAGSKINLRRRGTARHTMTS